MQSTQVMQQPQYPVNAPNAPNINSPLFAGYSAPMPNPYLPQLPQQIGGTQAQALGLGSSRQPMPNTNMPDINDPLFAGYSAPMPNMPNNLPDVNSPYFAGVGAPMPQQGPRGFNQGPRTEDDWKMFSARALFAPNTDMAVAKAQFLAGVGGSVRDPMQQQGGFGGQQQGFGSPQLPYATGAMPPQTMPQTGFTPMGGYDPQNTSYGSFGAIQQPMGGFQNIGSLLGKG
jgi:hypothetical protein